MYVREVDRPVPDINQKLLELSMFVISTCDLLRLPELKSRTVDWAQQGNPFLSISAQIYLPRWKDLGNATLSWSTLKIEEPDFGASVTVSRHTQDEQLPPDDPIVNYLLEGFKKHYKVGVKDQWFQIS